MVDFLKSSKDYAKSIAICPGVEISYFGIIKTLKSHSKTIKKRRNSTKSLHLFTVFWALLNPVLGFDIVPNPHQRDVTMMQLFLGTC